MNPEKRDYNGWILCRSTRFHGKYYYFNPATGEAVWNLSDMERRMLPQPNFTHSEKWHAYPEPDCPPEDTSSPWLYQHDFRGLPEASPPFGQVAFPKYVSNPMLPPGMPWGMHSMPQTVYMPPVMPMFNPMQQSWPNYRGNQIHFMNERSSSMNPYYVQKVPNLNQSANRQVFGMKTKPYNLPIFSQMSNQNRDLKKRSHMVTEINDKEPLFKRLRSQINLQNENLFRPSNNLNRSLSFESVIEEKVSQPTGMPSFQPKSNCAHHCDCCILSRSNENSKLSSQWSKLHENLTTVRRPQENIFKPAKLQQPGSMESLLNPPSEVSSNFSLENSFVFPLNKTDSKISSAKLSTSVKKVQNSTVSQSGLDKKILSESSDSKLSETDLRYILIERRKKSLVTDSKETSKQDQVEVKKIKTCYADAKKPYSEIFSKKRVTFDLGVEDMADENPDVDTAQGEENMAEPMEEAKSKICYVVADLEALLAEFELIEKFVKSDGTSILLIPAHIWRCIECTCADLSASRSHVIAARQISRHVARQAADNQSRILVQPEDPEAGSGETEDATLNCCLKVYDEEQGHISMLITNNEQLFDKAVAYELECYSTEDLKEYMGIPKQEVSFDIQKVGNTETAVTSAENGESSRNKLLKNLGVSPNDGMTSSRNNLLRNAYPETRDQFFLTKEQKATDDVRVQMLKEVKVNDRNPFLDNDDDLLEDTQRKIENLRLQEKIEIQKNKAIIVKKKIEEGKEKNNDDKSFEAKKDYYAAKKKIKSINVYNLDALLKSFSIKTKGMEERILVRMDEYVCIFCQIMEYMFEDIVKDAPCNIPEDNTKSFVQNQLCLLREVVTDHRTARTLVDKLTAVMDKAFVFIPDHSNKDKGRLKLQMAPNEFVQMFACGTLLLQVLTSISDDETLVEGGALLEHLGRSLSQWDEAPTPITPATPVTIGAVEPTPDFVKQRSEIKEYLAKHYPLAHAHHGQRPTRTQGTKPEVTEKVTSKVISTYGRNLGRLKLNPGKPVHLTTNKVNEDKENNDSKEKNNNQNTEDKIEDANSNNKTKTMRKLEFEKFKEIDVEKRENDDKELTEMLAQMLKKQPLTKRYDLTSIIINKDDNNADYVNKSEYNAKINPNKDLQVKFKNVTAAKTESQPKIMTIDDKLTHSSPNKIINDLNNKIAYDLDVLDYSDDIEETAQENEESIMDDSSSNKLVIVESDHWNDVTTTNHELDDSSPINEGNDVSKHSDSGHDNNDEADAGTCDSGVESYKAYSLVQVFLFNLSRTFITIKQFIEGSITDLSNGIDEISLDVLNQKVLEAHDAVMKIINNLNLIIDRESNPESALRQMLLKGGPDAKTDKRIIKYKRVISKCLSQARVLQRSLQILERIANKDLRVRELSDVSDNYSNLFE